METKQDFYELAAAAFLYVENVLRETEEHTTPQEAFVYMAVRGPLHSLN